MTSQNTKPPLGNNAAESAGHALSIKDLRVVAVVQNFALASVGIPLKDLELTEIELKRIVARSESTGPFHLESRTWIKVNLLELDPQLKPLKTLVNSINGRGANSPLSSRMTAKTPWGHLTHFELARHLESDIDQHDTNLRALIRDLESHLRKANVSSADIRNIADRFVDRLQITAMTRRTAVREKIRTAVYTVARRRFPGLRELRIRLLASPISSAANPLDQTTFELELLLSVGLELVDALQALVKRASTSGNWAELRLGRWGERFREIELIAVSCGFGSLSLALGAYRSCCLGRRQRPTDSDRVLVASLLGTLESMREGLLDARLSTTAKRVGVLTRGPLES